MADDDDWGWSSPQPSSPPAAPNQKPGKSAPVPQVASDDWGWGNSKPSNAPPPPDPNAITEHGWALPVGWDAQGNAHLDSDAGVVGLAKRAAQGVWSGATLPGDVATGKVDPNSPEAIRRSLDMASMAAPDSAIMTARKVLPPPTAQALDEAADAGYNAARNLDVHYSVPHVAEMARTVQQGLYDKGILPELAPKTHAILDKLQSSPDGAVSVPFTGLEGARRGFGNASRDFQNPTEQLAAGISKNAIDDFVTNPTAESVVSGPAGQAASLVTDARGNAAAAFRSNRINKGEDTAELNAAAANSGQNVGNSIRQRAKAILVNPKLAQGYNQEELDALRDVVKGDPVSNSLRIAGNILGGGGGMHSWITGATAGVEGALHFGPYGAATAVVPPIIGNLAKRADAALTSGRLQKADELVRSRSPLYRENAANAPLETTATPGAGIASRSAAAAALPAAGGPAPNAPPVATTRPAKRGDAAPRMTPEEAAAYVKSLPEGQTFAKGGAVKPRLKHEELVSRLMSACEKAKQETKKDTKALLNVPDNTVAHALEVAQKAI